MEGTEGSGPFIQSLHHQLYVLRVDRDHVTVDIIYADSALWFIIILCVQEYSGFIVSFDLWRNTVMQIKSRFH